MEHKLAEYRAKKKREKLINETKEKISSFLFKKSENLDSQVETSKKEEEELLINNDEDDQIEVLSDTEVDESLNCCTTLDLVYYALWFVLWVTVYVIFIKIGFGAVYFVLSALIGMYVNTRTKPKRKHEVSAYSVFNKDCKSIDGTLKGEQFEREMGYRM